MTKKKFVLLLVFFTVLTVNVVADSNIEIREVRTPSIVEKGQSFTVNTTVANLGSYNKNITVTAEALDQKKVSDSKRVKSGKKESFNLSFTTRMKDSGEFPIEIKAESRNAYDNTVVRRRISDIEGFFEFKPREPLVNTDIKIKGRLENRDLRTNPKGLEAELYMGNEYLGKVTTDEQGVFEKYYYTENVGSRTVKLVKNGETLMEKRIYIDAAVETRKESLREDIFKGRDGEICFENKLTGVEKGFLTFKTVVPEEFEETKEVYRDGQTVCFTAPNSVVGDYEGKVVLESEDGRHTDRQSFSYSVGEKRLEIKFDKNSVYRENGKVVAPITLKNRDRGEVNTWITLETDLGILSKPSPVKVGGRSEKTVELVFEEELGRHLVDVTVKSSQDRDTKELVLDVEETKNVFTGLITLVERGFGTGSSKVVGGLILLFLGYVAVSKITAPKPLEPLY